MHKPVFRAFLLLNTAETVMARYQSAATGEGTLPTQLCSFVRAPGNRAAAPFQPHNSETDVTLPATDSTRPATVAFNFGVST